MDIYFTTRRNRTHFNLNPNVLVYLGPSLDEAISSVGTLVDYEQTPPPIVTGKQTHRDR